MKFCAETGAAVERTEPLDKFKSRARFALALDGTVVGIVEAMKLTVTRDSRDPTKSDLDVRAPRLRNSFHAA